MSNAVGSDNTPIVSEQQLADHLAAGCKPAARFRIGTEHEKFVVARATHAAARYEDRPALPRCSSGCAATERRSSMPARSSA